MGNITQQNPEVFLGWNRYMTVVTKEVNQIIMIYLVEIS